MKILLTSISLALVGNLSAEPGVTQPASDISDWERDAAAAGLTDEPRIPGTGQTDRDASEAGVPIVPPGRDGNPWETDVHTDQIWDEREAIDEQLHDPEAEAAAEQREAEQQRFEEYTQEQAAARAAEEQKLLDELRAAADASVDSYRRYMEADGKITPEEEAKYDELTNNQIDLWQFTPAEEAEINAYGETRDRVAREIQQAADGLGGTDEAAVAARAQNQLMFDAATKTWRKATATGTAVDMVGDDIFHQRELGIAAKNRVLATQQYLQRTDLTDEERRAAESLLQQHQKSMENAALAISQDLFVITVGTTFDVGTLFLGRAGGVLSEALGGAKAAPGAGAGAAGAEAAGARAGTQAAAEGAETVIETGTAAARSGGSAGAVAEGGEAAVDAGRAALIESGETVIETGAAASRSGSTSGTSAATGGTAAGSASSSAGSTGRQLTQAELDELFKPGANLTGEQIIAKAEWLIQTHQRAVAEVMNRVGDMVEAGVITQSEAVSMAGKVVGAETRILPAATSSGSSAAATGAARTGPGATQVIPRTGPGSTQVIPRTGPGSTQVIPRTGPGSTQVIPRTGPGSTQVLPRTGTTPASPAASGSAPAGSGVGTAANAGDAAATAARNRKVIKDTVQTAGQIGATEVANEVWESTEYKQPRPKSAGDPASSWENAEVVGDSRSSIVAVDSQTGTNPFDQGPLTPSSPSTSPGKPEKPKKPKPPKQSEPEPNTPLITPPGSPIPTSAPTSTVSSTTSSTSTTTTSTTTTTPTTTTTTTQKPKQKKCQVAKVGQPSVSLKHGISYSGLCFSVRFEYEDSGCDGELEVAHETPSGQFNYTRWKMGGGIEYQHNIYSYGKHKFTLSGAYNSVGESMNLTGNVRFDYDVGPAEKNPGKCFIR
ncbi:MAG: CHASE3 domain-containing protein [bacterium]